MPASVAVHERIKDYFVAPSLELRFFDCRVEFRNRSIYLRGGVCGNRALPMVRLPVLK